MKVTSNTSSYQRRLAFSTSPHLKSQRILSISKLFLDGIAKFKDSKTLIWVTKLCFIETQHNTVKEHRY